MRWARAVGVAVLLVSVGVALGGSAPRREDVPKYLKMLQAGGKGKDRALAAEMLGKRGMVNYNDVKDAIEPLKTALREDTEAAVR